MENVKKLLEDLNAVIDGSAHRTTTSALAGEVEFTEAAEDLITLFLASEEIVKLDEAAVDEAFTGYLAEMATRAGEVVIFHDPENPPKAGSLKSEINDAMKLILYRHPCAQATAAGELGMKCWREAVDDVISGGKLFDTRTTKKTPDITVVDANYQALMHAFKEKLSKAGFDLTKQGEKRMVDQIEDTIKEAGKELKNVSGAVSKEAQSRAGRILASTKKRQSYAGRKVGKA